MSYIFPGYRQLVKWYNNYQISSRVLSYWLAKEQSYESKLAFDLPKKQFLDCQNKPQSQNKHIFTILILSNSNIIQTYQVEPHHF